MLNFVLNDSIELLEIMSDGRAFHSSFMIGILGMFVHSVCIKSVVLLLSSISMVAPPKALQTSKRLQRGFEPELSRL